MKSIKAGVCLCYYDAKKTIFSDITKHNVPGILLKAISLFFPAIFKQNPPRCCYC